MAGLEYFPDRAEWTAWQGSELMPSHLSRMNSCRLLDHYSTTIQAMRTANASSPPRTPNLTLLPVSVGAGEEVVVVVSLIRALQVIAWPSV